MIKRFWLGIPAGLLVTGLPLIAFACGALAPTAVSAPSLAAAQLFLESVVQPQLVVKPTSTATTLVWPSAPPLPAELARVYAPLEFSTSIYANPAAALADADLSHWQPTLPVSTPQGLSARHLWVRLVHRTDASQSVALELTLSSQLLAVQPNGGAALSAFVRTQLAPQVVVDPLNSFSDALQWSGAVPALTPDLAAEYYPPEFSDFRRAPPSATTPWSAVLPTSFEAGADRLWVRFRPRRVGGPVEQMEVPLTASRLKEVILASERTAAISALNTLRFSDDPTAAAAAKNNRQLVVKHLVVAAPVSALPARWLTYYTLAFSTVQFATPAAAAADENVSHWRAALPQQSDLRPAHRALWARFQPRMATSTRLPIIIVDLTASSGLSDLVATADDYGVILDAYIGELFGLRYALGSTHAAVRWDPLTLAPFLALPAEVTDEYAPIEYLITTPDGPGVTATIPTSFAPAPRERFLRLTIRPRRGSRYRVDFPLDLTMASKIQDLP